MLLLSSVRFTLLCNSKCSKPQAKLASYNLLWSSNIKHQALAAGIIFICRMYTDMLYFCTENMHHACTKCSIYRFTKACLFQLPTNAMYADWTESKPNLICMPILNAALWGLKIGKSPSCLCLTNHNFLASRTEYDHLWTFLPQCYWIPDSERSESVDKFPITAVRWQ